MTCVRVPVLRAHCESINLEFNRKITLEEVYECLEAAPGVKVVDDRAVRSALPHPLTRWFVLQALWLWIWLRLRL